MEKQFARINRRPRQHSRDVHAAGFLGFPLVVLAFGALLYEMFS